MTIIVGVATPDGIVMAADSRTTSYPDGIATNARHRILSDSAEKLFSICDRFGVATFGQAFIGSKTIGGHMDEFIVSVQGDPPATIDDLADGLGTFFHDRYVAWRHDAGQPWDPSEPAQLGFLIAGYDDKGIGHVKEVHVPGPSKPETGIDTTVLGLAYRGQEDVIHRLLAGVDWGALAASPLNPDAGLIEELNKIEYRIIYPVTLQDGIDFATFLIRTTVDMQRFSDGLVGGPGGTPGCGGPTRVLVVMRRGAEAINPTLLEMPAKVGAAEGALGH